MKGKRKIIEHQFLNCLTNIEWTNQLDSNGWVESNISFWTLPELLKLETQVDRELSSNEMNVKLTAYWIVFFFHRPQQI